MRLSTTDLELTRFLLDHGVQPDQYIYHFDPHYYYYQPDPHSYYPDRHIDRPVLLLTFTNNKKICPQFKSLTTCVHHHHHLRFVSLLSAPI